MVRAANDVALQVLANRSLLASIVAFSSGVPYFVYQVKQQLVCARDDFKGDYYYGEPEDIALWQNAICQGDRRTLEALQLLSKTPALGTRMRSVLRGILDFALLHTKDMALLEWINDKDIIPSNRSNRFPGVYKRAISGTVDIEMIKWIASRGYTFSKDLSFSVAFDGNLELLQALYEAFGADASNFGCKVELIMEAATGGHLAVIKFLHENAPDCECRYSHLPIHNPITAVKEAAINGHLEVVKYLHENALSDFSQRVMSRVTENEEVEVVRYLHDTMQKRSTSAAMKDAIYKNNLEMLKLLCETRGDGALEGAIQFAAKRGQLKYVKFLFEVIPEGSTPRLSPREDLVNHATKNGHLELIKFFHEHDHFRFSAKTMHNAAINNHLRVVKFLHENRSEGCKVNTLFECDRCRLPCILQYLSMHRPMASPEKAIARAKKEDRLLLAAKLRYGFTAGKTTFVYR